MGRVIALLFLVWLALVILGGLGVGPVARVPLGNVLRPSAGPPPLRQVPQPVAPAPADLVPALPAPRAAANPTTRAATRPSARHGKSALPPGHTKRTATTASRGRSAAAPGHTSTSKTRGKSPAAPGRVKRTTTTTATTTTAVPGKKLGHAKKP